MDVIVLAAGLGTRLKNRTELSPKAMVRVARKPLLQYSLDSFLSQPFIDRAVVVTGFERDQVKIFLETYNSKKPIVEAYNPDFRKGNFYSLLKGLEKMPEEFILTNADHIFPEELLAEVHSQSRGVTAVCDFDRVLAADCMKVRTESGQDGDRMLRAISKKLYEYDCGYIGMTWVHREGITAFAEAVKEVEGTGDTSAYAELVLQKLAELRRPPSLADASGFGWLEVDTEEDLIAAESTLQEYPQFLKRGRS